MRKPLKFTGFHMNNVKNMSIFCAAVQIYKIIIMQVRFRILFTFQL